MTISQGFELATDGQFKELSNFALPPRAGRITALEGSGQVRIASDDADGVDVIAWPLDGFEYAVDDVVYVGFAVNSPDSAIVIGGKSVAGGGVFIRRDGTLALTAEWDIGEDMAIRLERLEARDSEGLSIQDDGGNVAIFIKDGGNHVGVGTVTPGDNIVGTIDYTTEKLLQVDGAHARLILRASSTAAIDLIDTGGGANAKWMQILAADDEIQVRSVSDAGAVQAADILVLTNTTGAVRIGHTLTVTGAVDFDSTLDVDGTLNVDGASTFNANLTVGNQGFIILKDPDVAHGMTTPLLATDNYAMILPMSATAGGLRLVGASDSDAIAFNLQGIIGTDAPTLPAATIRADKKNGVTSQALAAGEIVMAIDNATTRLVRVLGNGDLLMVSGATLTMETVRAVDASGLIFHDDGGNLGLVVEDGGQVGVGIAAPTATLHVSETQTAGEALRVVRDLAAASTDSPLVNFIQDNASDDQVLLRGQQDGSGDILNLFDGATEVMTLLDGGNFGLNVAAPQGRVHGHDGTSGMIFVTKTGVVNSAQTVIPDGTGDITGGITGFFVADDGGGAVASTFTLTPGTNVDVVIGGYTLRIAVSAGGALTVIRQAGAGTADVTILAIWQ